eukprot:2126165-Pyramimonas_sp.AAC.1
MVCAPQRVYALSAAVRGASAFTAPEGPMGLPPAQGGAAGATGVAAGEQPQGLGQSLPGAFS